MILQFETAEKFQPEFKNLSSALLDEVGNAFPYSHSRDICVCSRTIRHDRNVCHPKSGNSINLTELIDNGSGII
jgi:hypothetical protein